jgi:hypothetical protein
VKLIVEPSFDKTNAREKRSRSHSVLRTADDRMVCRQATYRSYDGSDYLSKRTQNGARNTGACSPVAASCTSIFPACIASKLRDLPVAL